MIEYEEQILRIKDKLVKAKNADWDLKSFGAERHKYQLHPPATPDEVSELEQTFSIKLPDAYKAFILTIGNGGISISDSAAGPFYGIYPLGKNVNELIYENPERYLSNDCMLFPEMNDETWEFITQRINDDNIPDVEFECEIGKIYGGILPIGSQGCSYIHGIILNGEHTGKVVNLDIDRQKPQFTFENNFLDWYERWLDEVIDGTLRQSGPSWFGYGMGGSAEMLLEKYLGSNNSTEKEQVLSAILRKANLPEVILSRIETEYIQDKSNLLLLEILTKFNAVSAKKYLIESVEIDFKNTFRIIQLHASDKASEWIRIIEENITRVSDIDTYISIRKILGNTKSDYGKILLPLFNSKDEKIRSSVINTLGNLRTKHDYMRLYIKGLNDESESVVLHALYAMYETKDPILLPHYKRIIDRLPDEKNHMQNLILGAIDSNLQLFGLSMNEL